LANKYEAQKINGPNNGYKITKAQNLNGSEKTKAYKKRADINGLGPCKPAKWIGMILDYDDFVIILPRQTSHVGSNSSQFCHIGLPRWTRGQVPMTFWERHAVSDILKRHKALRRFQVERLKQSLLTPSFRRFEKRHRNVTSSH
jgi:hypothetical protein